MKSEIEKLEAEKTKRDFLMRFKVFKKRFLYRIIGIAIPIYLGIYLNQSNNEFVNIYFNQYGIYFLFFIGFGFIYLQLIVLLKLLFMDNLSLMAVDGIIDSKEYGEYLKETSLTKIEILAYIEHDDDVEFVRDLITDVRHRGNFQTIINDEEIMIKAIQKDFYFLNMIGQELAQNNNFKSIITNYFNTAKQDLKIITNHIFQLMSYTSTYHKRFAIISIEEVFPDIAKDILSIQADILHKFFTNLDMYLELENVNDFIVQKNNEDLIYSHDKCEKWFIPFKNRKKCINFGTFYKIDSGNLLCILIGTENLYLGIVKHNNYVIQEASEKEHIDGLEFRYFKSIHLKWHSKKFYLSEEKEIFYDFENSNFNKVLKQFLDKFDDGL